MLVLLKLVCIIIILIFYHGDPKKTFFLASFNERKHLSALLNRHSGEAFSPLGINYSPRLRIGAK